MYAAKSSVFCFGSAQKCRFSKMANEKHETKSKSKPKSKSKIKIKNNQKRKEKKKLTNKYVNKRIRTTANCRSNSS